MKNILLVVKRTPRHDVTGYCLAQQRRRTLDILVSHKGRKVRSAENQTEEVRDNAAVAVEELKRARLADLVSASCETLLIPERIVWG
jgi:hypothetical protein